MTHEIEEPAPATRLAPPLLEARALCFASGQRRLLHHVDITVRPGRRTVLMGPNGAGKSLLLRCLHGLLRPGGGTVLWRGAPLDRAGRCAQAMVLQRPVMLRRSVGANLRFALAGRGLARAERRARAQAALETARLGHLARRPARTLSGGEQQRLAIARALSLKPELLLLDEPTASLDPASTLAVETLINAAHAEGVAILLVTHDAGQARRLGDEIVFLQGGRVVETGAAEQVLNAPRTDAARAWLAGRIHVEPDA